jgi:hypothetical protein
VGQRHPGLVRERDELLHDVDAALVAEVGEVAAGAAQVGLLLCIPPLGTDDTSRADRMIAMLVDGLWYGANPDSAPTEPGRFSQL